ncbi:RNA 3'-terminal phosphate cyclase [Massilia sp. Leaf139]|uniref:RNA 3'-terminal phosphate cyclase n=1 Tax=Massilia sp. Leaf139 TaxID=1736272 RepID=UPI0006FE8DD6|nr:RNA 3'-terminal phosphate cyclase [Massilia sp. Leaf139]KQQ90232.1 RNA 3'-phosphate cyclase [Massilia sp. Leaf139]
MIELDGAAGEGGGQILRSALALAMITGQPFRIRRIRANRAKPGLMRQHLVAVQAAAEVSGARVTGAELGSSELQFVPGRIRGGDYRFAIGTAGSCTLVLQTVVLALLYAERPSTIRITGGTHNVMAPPVQFLQQAYLPLLARMGAHVDIDLLRYGFYPAGGGEVVARISPCQQWRQLVLHERGRLLSGVADALVAGLPSSVGQRELGCIGVALGWQEEQLRLHRLPGEQGPGNAVLITLEHEQVREVFAGFGAKAVRAEAVAQDAIAQAQDYLASGAAVGEHLADQLMLPMALAGGGAFTASTISLHATTNAEVIGRFLPVAISFEEEKGRHRCVVKSTCQAG